MREEKVRFREVNSFIRQVRKVRKRGLPAILEAQRKNLRKLLRHAYERVPFYRRLYGNIDIDKINLADLPPVTKPQLMSEFSDTLSERGISIEEVKEFVSRTDLIGQLFKGCYVALYTSGSTGECGYFLSDIPSWQRAQALGFRSIKLPSRYFLSITPFFRVRVALIVATGGHYASPLVPKIDAPIARYFSKFYEMDLLKPEEEIVSELNETKPHHIHTYPSFAQVLVENQEAGRLTFKPFSLSVSSEPFSPSLRKRLFNAFNPIEIVEGYAATEVLHIAKSCPIGRMHLATDWVIVEPVTEAGHPVPPGERSGKVLVTNLFNYFQPLIRYEMTDVVRINPKPCECGDPLPLIEVLGRTNDILTVISPGGKKFRLSPVPLLMTFSRVLNLKKFQIIHDRQNHLLINYIPDKEGEEEEVEAAIIELFKRNSKRYGVLNGVEVVPQMVAEIPRDPMSCKIKQIIDMTGEQAVANLPEARLGKS